MGRFLDLVGTSSKRLRMGNPAQDYTELLAPARGSSPRIMLPPGNGVLGTSRLPVYTSSATDVSLGAQHSGAELVCDNAAANTVTIEAAWLPLGSTGLIRQQGAGQTTLQAASVDDPATSDLLLLLIATQGASASAVTPSGYTAIAHDAQDRIALFYRIVDGTEGASIAATLTSGVTSWLGYCTLLTLNATSSPIDGTAFTSFGTLSNTTAFTPPSLTTAVQTSAQIVLPIVLTPIVPYILLVLDSATTMFTGGEYNEMAGANTWATTLYAQASSGTGLFNYPDIWPLVGEPVTMGAACVGIKPASAFVPPEFKAIRAAVGTTTAFSVPKPGKTVITTSAATLKVLAQYDAVMWRRRSLGEVYVNGELAAS